MDTATTKERPILFSAPMVRAILEGRKTQTRRVVKVPPDVRIGSDGFFDEIIGDGSFRSHVSNLRCPYGKPGDRLWLREEHFRFGHWASVPDVTTRTGRGKWQFVGDSDEVLFEQPRELCRSMNAPYFDRPGWYKRVARYMPRWASRIDLEITGVRFERLQDINEADAFHEGAERPECGPFELHGVPVHPMTGSYQEGFKKLWESINGPDSWAANPWVWVIEFQRIGGAK